MNKLILSILVFVFGLTAQADNISGNYVSADEPGTFIRIDLLETGDIVATASLGTVFTNTFSADTVLFQRTEGGRYLHELGEIDLLLQVVVSKTKGILVVDYIHEVEVDGEIQIHKILQNTFVRNVELMEVSETPKAKEFDGAPAQSLQLSDGRVLTLADLLPDTKLPTGDKSEDGPVNAIVTEDGRVLTVEDIETPESQSYIQFGDKEGSRKNINVDDNGRGQFK